MCLDSLVHCFCLLAFPHLASFYFMVYKRSQRQTAVVMNPSCFRAELKLIIAFFEMYIRRLNKKKFGLLVEEV